MRVSLRAIPMRIHLPDVFSSHMALQAAPLRARLWGSALPRANVTAFIDGQAHAHTSAGPTGSFSLELLPQPMGVGHTIVLSDHRGSEVILRDIAFGDILLCAGQSNMGMPLRLTFNGDETLASANRHEIRLYHVPPPSSETHPTLQWRRSTPDSLANFSALCYLTAIAHQRMRSEHIQSVAVYGLVGAAVGSTDILQWMSLSARRLANRTCWQTLIRSTWRSPIPWHQGLGYPGALDSLHASRLWKVMLKPIVPLAIRGVLWDQGEADVFQGVGPRLRRKLSTAASDLRYNCLFASLVADWRGEFQSRDLPVAAVQLGSYWSLERSYCCSLSALRFAQSDSLPAASTTGSLRVYNPRYNLLLQQRMARNGTLATDPHERRVANPVRVPHTGLVATYDLGSSNPKRASNDPSWHWWIHQRNKSEVARRLALQFDRLLQHQEQDGHMGGFIDVGVMGGRRHKDWSKEVTPRYDSHSSAGRSTWARRNEDWSGPVARQLQQLYGSTRHNRGPVYGVMMRFDHAHGLALQPAQGCLQCCGHPKLSQNRYGPSVFQLADSAGKWMDATARVATHHRSRPPGHDGHGNSTSARILVVAPMPNQHVTQADADNALARVALPAGYQFVGIQAGSEHEPIQRGKTSTGTVNATHGPVVKKSVRKHVSTGHITAIRYAVMDIPQCVLYNSNGLPALPFELAMPLL